MIETMDDIQFLNYMEAHCRTERKLFSRLQIGRLLKLADAEYEFIPNSEWDSYPPDFIDPLVHAARIRLGYGMTMPELIAENEEILNGFSKHEPLPVQNENPIVQELVIADIRERMEVGKKRYGTYLQANNGRDALVDLYQELLDAVQYVRQEMEERRMLWKLVGELFIEAGFLMPERNYKDQEMFIKDIKHALADSKIIRRERDILTREREGEVWIWQGDEHDHPESITCPILIQPTDLNQFIIKIEQLRTYIARASYVAEKYGYKDAPEGKDLWQFLLHLLEKNVAQIRGQEVTDAARGVLIVWRALKDSPLPVLQKYIVQCLQDTAYIDPIPMMLLCPSCGKQHIDVPDPAKGWTNPPHKSHLCEHCGTIWRPAPVYTVGVAAVLPRGRADNWSGAFLDKLELVKQEGS